jgi:hypothetical protein
VNKSELQVQTQLIKYYDNEYYLGYLMLAHLVIQMHILEILKRIESTFERESKLFPYKEQDREKSLEEYTFGTLIGCLNKFIESDCLFNGGRYSECDQENTTKFCQFECCKTKIGGLNDLVGIRNKIGHRLISDLVDIKDLESEIIGKFSKEKIRHIIDLLSSIKLELSQREANPDYFDIWEKFYNLQTETPVLDERGKKVVNDKRLWKFKKF